MLVNWPERFFCNSPVRSLILRRQIGLLKEMSGQRAGGRWLEIGCGNGKGMRHAVRAFAPSRYAALDPDPAMAGLAARQVARIAWDIAARAGSENDGQGEAFPAMSVLRGDAQTLPFADQSFDAVLNMGIVHHLEDWRAGLAEVARVLVSDGLFLFEEILPALYAGPILRHVVAHPERDRFDGPQFLAQLAAVGLELSIGCRESRYTILGVARKSRPLPG